MPWKLLEPAVRVRYNRNSLVVVIFQLRFHPILAVQRKLPDFQDRVRKRFPQFEELQVQEGRLFPTGTLETRDRLEYRFKTADDTTSIILGEEALALENRKHIGRDHFFEDIELAIGALTKVYGHVDPIRLGIRYVNRIQAAEIGESLGREVDLTELVNPDFLRIPAELADLDGTLFNVEVRSGRPEGELTLRYGLVPDPGKHQNFFKFDIDRYMMGNFDVKKTVEKLRGMVTDIVSLFNVAAGPALREWMGPKEPGEHKTSPGKGKRGARH